MNEGQIPGRRSIRLKGYDYSQGGGYFITIVTLWRECLFGKIVSGEMQVNDLGRIVEECFQAIPQHYSHAEIGPVVVMPNHMHGIVMIYTNLQGDASENHGTIPIVGARHASPLLPRGTLPGSLGAIVGSFKSSVSRRAGRELNSGNIWQRNYYEHILRDQHDYERIANYIAANPTNWGIDRVNPNQIQFPA